MSKPPEAIAQPFEAVPWARGRRRRAAASRAVEQERPCPETPRTCSIPGSG